jgi:hypothetical protein
MVPRVARGSLRLAVAAAEEFAAKGRLVMGYDCLMHGLAGARVAVERDEPWAADVALCYLQAIEDYIARYGLRMEVGNVMVFTASKAASVRAQA